MPKKPNRFQIPTMWLLHHWSMALTENLTWNEFIGVMMEDKEFLQLNEDFFNSDHKAVLAAAKWASDTFPDKSDAYRANQARMLIISDKVLVKVNNLRSLPQFKKGDTPLDRPRELNKRIGRKAGNAAARIDWKAAMSQFSDEMFNGQ
jgi:hypothetical protein